MPDRRLAVVDLGSNTFRLVVYTWRPGKWWKRTDELFDAVRVGEGVDEAGALQPEPMERGLRTIDLYADYVRATGLDEVRAVATSAIREASNQQEFLSRAALPVQVLSREEEARYGYLAAVNSTTLADGVVLDIGGGSLQLTRVAGREALDPRSWKLGAVRMTERFRGKKAKALREHAAGKLASAGWLSEGGRLVGLGGAVRNLAAADQLAAGIAPARIQGHVLTRKRLESLVEKLEQMSVAERRKLPGIKPERGDVILAAAVVVQTVLEVGAFKGIEVTESGLREGVFYETLLGDPPLLESPRQAGVRNLAAQYHPEPEHTEHVARLALAVWDDAAQADLHGGDAEERELLEAAALLHDVGMAIDYDDHHKHSRYLVLNAGVPGFSPRETALIAEMTRFHRKGNPVIGADIEPLTRKGDDALLARCAAALRVAEHLERAHDRSVVGARLAVSDGKAELRLEAKTDASIAKWEAQRQADVFERAFGRKLQVV